MASDASSWPTAEAKVLAQKGVRGRFTEVKCEFQTPDGRTITTLGSINRWSQKISTVTVYYDPNRPERNLLSPEGTMFMGHVCTVLGGASAAMGLLLIATCISTIVKRRRDNRLFEQKRAAKWERRANRAL